jgi:hypothetical protein
VASLIIHATNNTPRVYFDLSQGRIELRGRCFPENPSKFYDPLIAWLNAHITGDSIEARFEVYLEYYNTGTYIRLLEIFDLLSKKNDQGHKLEVHWYVEEEDEDSIDNAKSFMDVAKLPFKLRTLPTINFGGR